MISYSPSALVSCKAKKQRPARGAGENIWGAAKRNPRYKRKPSLSPQKRAADLSFFELVRNKLTELDLLALWLSPDFAGSGNCPSMFLGLTS